MNAPRNVGRILKWQINTVVIIINDTLLKKVDKILASFEEKIKASTFIKWHYIIYRRR